MKLPRHFATSVGGILATTLGTLALVGLTACDDGTPKDPLLSGPFKVNFISTGLGQVYPYRIRELDSFGNPTTTVLNVEKIETLKANVNGNNDVLPVATFGTTPTLPNGNPGNHFLFIQFSNKLDVNTILDSTLAGQTNSGLTTAISLVTYNQSTESTSVLLGRGFVGGYTYYNEGGTLRLRQAVRKNSAGNAVEVVDPRAAGFPRGFSGDVDLVAPNSFVFVADDDGDLSDFDIFDNTSLLQIVVTNAVRNERGKVLREEVSTATTVGPDSTSPQVRGFAPGRTLEITPGNGQSNVDPTAPVLVRFNKPIQPGTVGSFLNRANLTPPGGGVTLGVTLGATSFNVIYYADPLSFADLTNYLVTPAYSLPGQSGVTVSVNNSRIRGTNTILLGQAVSTTFNTGDGPGIVNAPVSPEAVYVGVGGSEPGISVIDLNGFGQGTGDPTTSRFPLNPNIGQPGVRPNLAPGTSRLDGGSQGALTLVQDSAGKTKLVGAPTIGQVGDIHVGCPLDIVFNNENVNVNASRANQTTPLGLSGALGNSISVAPHPNPPRLVFPPPNTTRAIFGEEPSVTSTSGPTGTILANGAGCIPNSPVNLLRKGNPFANEKTQVGIYGNLMEGVFYGPQPPPTSPPPPVPYCPFTSRQQIGHFLYVLDRDNKQVVVLNSNRMTILDTIRLSDPTSMAMAPNMTRLAVTNFASSTVTFIDIDPTSPSLHQVVAETRVDPGPTGIAWQPDGEDVFVVSSSGNSATVLNGLDYGKRKSISGFLNSPIEVAVSERYQTTGTTSGVYYAYVLNATGTIAVYESGPDGVNGIGFNDIIGIVPNVTFRRPSTIKLDYTSSNSGMFVGHVDESGLGQISRLDLTTSPIGPQQVNPNQGGFIQQPSFRQKEWTVIQRFGGLNANTPIKDLLSGNAPVDIAVDEMFNNGASPGQVTPFSTQIPQPPMNHSGKGSVKVAGGAAVQPILPKLIFVALRDVGKVDIFEFGTGRKVKTIDVPGVAVVGTYWRQ
ncbi:MAG: hypothetical protein IT458_04665 [Planctomycetes bacterium]|nr:hypothetical protein [Planctomycetota bacterium]